MKLQVQQRVSVGANQAVQIGGHARQRAEQGGGREMDFAAHGLRYARTEDGLAYGVHVSGLTQSSRVSFTWHWLLAKDNGNRPWSMGFHPKPGGPRNSRDYRPCSLMHAKPALPSK